MSAEVFLRPSNLGLAENVFRWWLGVGCGVWGVGFYRFSGGQLPNFQGKRPEFSPQSLQWSAIFERKKV